jgi:hypothetical protein
MVYAVSGSIHWRLLLRIEHDPKRSSGRGLSIAAPGSTPYRVAICFQLSGIFANWGSIWAGWSDGTKFDILRIQDTGISHETWSNTTTRVSFSGATIGNLTPAMMPMVWLGFWNDGTTLHFGISLDGANYQDTYFVTLASSYLGSGNYTKLAWGTNSDSYTHPFAGSIRCYDTAGLSRVVG